MSWSEIRSKVDRAQQSMLFKLVASGAILLVAIGMITWHAIAVAKASADADAKFKEMGLVSPHDTPADALEANKKAASGADAAIEKALKAEQDVLRRFKDQLSSVGSFAAGVALASGVALATVWIGLGLTMLALAAIGAVVLMPLLLMPDIRDRIYENSPSFSREAANRYREVGKFGAGVLALTIAFVTLTRGLVLLLSPSHPVFAIARNVVNEAVRMKVSLIFIVMLILALAALPGLLEPSSPLRYRVQSFLQYGVGGSYMLTAILVLFLSASTVAVEQRDKVIWQTMTKPVAPRQYLLGKWLGATAVGVLLLGVSSCGVYLFTQYLRNQPASGETAAYISRGESYSQDRFILEFQVLAGRQTTNIAIPEADANEIQAIALREKEKATKQRASDGFSDVPSDDKLIRDAASEVLRKFLTVNPTDSVGREFMFDGLHRAKALGMPLTLRFKINSGGNDPSAQYRLTFLIGETNEPRRITSPLAQAMSEPILPSHINDKGQLHLRVYNGDLFTGVPNPEPIYFSAADGLQVSYPVASFAENYFNAALLLAVKVMFLSAIAVSCATFLSFSVSCLVAFSIFIVAENGAFLSRSLETFDVLGSDMKSVVWYKQVILWIADAVVTSVQSYAKLSPISSLVDGRYVSFTDVLLIGTLLTSASIAIYALGATILRQRELATYSGQ